MESHFRNKKECYIIGHEDSRFHVNMTQRRFNAASIVVGNRLWVLGGCCIQDSSQTSEYVSIIDGIDSEVGPDLPIPIRMPTVVSLNETTAMLISDSRSFDRLKTFYYTHFTQHWIPGPNMMEHSMFQWNGGFIKAGIITDHITLKDRVVVFGNENNRLEIDEKHIMGLQILENNQWKIGTVVE